MAEVGDLLYVKFHFRRGGVEALMAGYWKILSMTGEELTTFDNVAQALHETYDGAIHQNIGAPTSDFYKTVVEKTESEFFGEYANPTLGGDSGDNLPDFVAMAVKQNVSTRLTRNGYKRIPFICEPRSLTNTPVISAPVRADIEGFFGGSQTIASSIAPTVEITGSWQIVKRVETAPGSGEYEPDYSQLNPVVNAVVTRITSQNSRKS